jgi:hypothetical protein
MTRRGSFNARRRTMDDIKLPATRATAIAAANAVVSHLKLGLFISEVNHLASYTIRNRKFEGHASIAIEGRSNTGDYICFTGTVLYKEDRSGQFPVEKVFITRHEDNPHRMTFYECTFGEERIEVRKFDENPYV